MSQPPVPIISVSFKDFLDLKKLYKECPNGGTFMWKGEKVLKEYAGYLIEYLDTKYERTSGSGKDTRARNYDG